ncbi:MAG: hypothetical protein ACJAX7_002417 [Saprospiraceae bacterium]|jgi:hypothetical protein
MRDTYHVAKVSLQLGLQLSIESTRRTEPRLLIFIKHS